MIGKNKGNESIALIFGRENRNIVKGSRFDLNTSLRLILISKLTNEGIVRILPKIIAQGNRKCCMNCFISTTKTKHKNSDYSAISYD